MKISKLTITSIFSGYPDLINEKNPSIERASRLIKERLYARDGYFTENDNLPQFLRNVVSSVKKVKSGTENTSKTFIG